MVARPLGIFFLSRIALLGAIEVARRFMILPSHRPDPGCIFGVCEPHGWLPLVLAELAMAAAVVVLWFLVQRDDGVDAAGSTVVLFLASPLSLVLALDAAAATSTALSLLALGLARRHAWAAGISLAAATAFAPGAALMAPAVVLAAWSFDLRGMRLNALFGTFPALVVVAVGGTAPVIAAPWLQVDALMMKAGSPGSLIHFGAVAVMAAVCLVAFASRRFVIGLAGASWLVGGLALGAPHLVACTAAPWGPTAVVSRTWALEAPIAASLFMVQGLYLFHLVHGFPIL